MSRSILVGLVLLPVLFLSTGSDPGEAQYHPPQYLVGGQWSASATIWNGLWLADPTAGTFRLLTPSAPIYDCFAGFRMDVDNRHVVFAAHGDPNWLTSNPPTLRSGVFRLDPATLRITTVLASTLSLMGPHSLTVNQDGDYVFACRQFANNTRRYVDTVLKLGSAGNTLTTILDSRTVGATPIDVFSVGRDIDTGLHLVNLSGPSRFYYAVLRYDASGTFTTFGGGAVPNHFGWYGWYDTLPQNHDTGSIEGFRWGMLYRLRPGALARTSLYQINPPPFHSVGNGTLFDLQSAPTPRVITAGHATHLPLPPNPPFTSPALYFTDLSAGYPTVPVDLDPTNRSGLPNANLVNSMAFYRGRHLQTLRIGARQWDIRMSVPLHPNKPYVLALGQSGVRPATKLADGRRIHLVPDILTWLSMSGSLAPFFRAGPGVLDARGEAQGRLDLRTLPPLGGVPIWMAMAVLDSLAPSGIAYLPDTYVFRMP